MRNIIILLLLSIQLNAQTSIGHGNWSNSANWSGGIPSYTINWGSIVNIHSTIISVNDITVAFNGVLNIGGDGKSSIDSLIIDAKLLSAIGSDVIIHADGVLYILGDLSNQFFGNLIVDGALVVLGDASNSFSTINVGSGGSVHVEGDFNNNNGTIINNGSVVVDGTFVGNPPTGNPLPINLVYFTAYASINSITLNWQTASEENNDYFTLERSVDGINYEVIGTISGAGNSNVLLEYIYIDSKPLSDTLYYRLTQTDYNGDSEVFKPISVLSIKHQEITLYPNPANTYFELNIISYIPIMLYTSSGVLIKTVVDNKMNIEDISPGNYIVILHLNGYKISKTLVIQ